MLLPVISIGAIKLFSFRNDKPILTTILFMMFFSAGIYVLFSAHKRITEIYDGSVIVTTKYYLRNKTTVLSYPVKEVMSVGYFEGVWSGGQPDPRCHIYLIFSNGNNVKIDSQRMYRIPFAGNSNASLKTEAERLAKLLEVSLDLNAKENG